VLGREGSPPVFDAAGGFFRAVHQDPVLSRKKLIAEPWDVCRGGYQLGKFGVLWSEWNGQFRDTLRALWRGDQMPVEQLALRLTGSPDLFQPSGRLPSASVNFVTCHDGFTLHDLVTYAHKHNEPNPGGDHHGADDNQSWNDGVEGESASDEIHDLRERQKRNLLTMLVLARGVPMLAAGDELGRSQRGNNNAYCLDDQSTWLDWDLDDGRRALLGFTRRLLALRRELEVVRADAFFGGELGDAARADRWLRPDGAPLGDGEEGWKQPLPRALELLLRQPGGKDVLVLMNAGPEPQIFTLPPTSGAWRARVDTRGADAPSDAPLQGGATHPLPPWALAVFVGA
jgi:glycogen operon protein